MLTAPATRPRSSKTGAAMQVSPVHRFFIVDGIALRAHLVQAMPQGVWSGDRFGGAFGSPRVAMTSSSSSSVSAASRTLPRPLLCAASRCPLRTEKWIGRLAGTTYKMHDFALIEDAEIGGLPAGLRQRFQEWLRTDSIGNDWM